jgi:beta-N-acetylhexosaminidase
MNLKAKISQLIVGGFDGTSPPKELTQLIKTHGMGGLILFKNNLEDPIQIAKLTNRLQRLSRLAPLLILIDQEGGRVSRLPPPFTQFPAAALLGVCNSYDLCYRLGQAMARELRAVGINMNLTPVLDVYTNPANTVIGDRAFGNNPTLVSKLGLALMVGLQDQGVIACGKHFPGHGDTIADSHHELPKVTHPLSRLIEVELKPFQHLIQNRLQAIMTAHVVYTALDPQFPATLSKKIVTKLLREAMEFRGLVITDDLHMKAVADHYPLAEAAIRAITAGADLLLFCRQPELLVKVQEALYQTVKRGSIPEKRIDLSLDRILSLKERVLLPYRPSSLKEIRNRVGHPDHQKIVQEIQERAGRLASRKAPASPSAKGLGHRQGKTF